MKQTQEISQNRLGVLDGLRGFAILLVFFSHIPYGYLYQILPVYYFGWLFQNGVTGVTFLFILSGFLMYYIYPNPTSGSAFLQKRYTRIFPLFLTMCAVMLTARETTGTPILLFATVLILFPTLTNLLWTKVVKKLPRIVGTRLFQVFIGVQIAVGLFYVLWIDRHTFAAFATLPIAIREGLIFAVNATLTLPLGQYVPMLDGVYWTLVAEVLFYAMYPFLVVPLITYLLPKSKKIKLVFLLCLFFLLGGVHMLSYKIFVLSLLQPALFFYFVAGIVLAHLYKYHKDIFAKFSKTFSGVFYVVPLLVAFLTVMTLNNLSFLGQVISPWVRMIFTIPITFCIAIILSEKTILSRFFNLRFLRFLGTISYSIYLSHSLVIGIAKSLYLPTNLITNFFYLLIVFAIDCIVAYFLFTLLEKPYFIKSTHKLVDAKKEKKSIPAKTLLFGIGLIYVIGVFVGYQSKDRFNFFSYFVPIQLPRSSPLTIRSNNPYTFEFRSVSDNFGLLSVRIAHIIAKNNSNPQTMQFSLFEKEGTKQLVIAVYNLDEFNNGLDFPFGFPTIVHAKGKTYIARFSLLNPTSKDFLTMYPNSVKAVYSADKKSLLTHPLEMTTFLESKLQEIFTNQEALFVLLLCLPFFTFSFMV